MITSPISPLFFRQCHDMLPVSVSKRVECLGGRERCVDPGGPVDGVGGKGLDRGTVIETNSLGRNARVAFLNAYIHTHTIPLTIILSAILTEI